MNPAVKILSFILTSGGVAAASVLLFAVMLLAMNGYSEQDAGWGIILFLIWAVVISLLSGLLSVLTVNFLAGKRKINLYLASLIAVVGFIIVGVIINFIGVVAGIGLAEFKRVYL